MSSHVHPLVGRLAADCGSADDDAERAFWKDIESLGTPLIEADNGFSWVTFVHPLEATERHACVRGFTLSPTDAVLNRVGVSNVAAASFRIRNDRRFGYDFVVDAPLIDPLEASPEEQRAFAEHMATHPPQQDRFGSCLRKAQLDESRTYAEIELPDAPRQTHFSTEPRGQLRHVSSSELILSRERPIWVYVPVEAESRDSLPVVYVISADGYLNRMWANATIDSLIRSKQIPPILGVFIDTADGRTMRNDFGFDQSFQDDLGLLTAWLRDAYPVAANPSSNAIAGASIGGLTALYTADQKPELFGAVISQSGSFWMQSDAWRMTDVARDNLRVYLDVGQDEHPELMIAPNRALRDHLESQAIHFSYSEFPGGHDYVCWRGTFANGLAFAFG